MESDVCPERDVTRMIGKLEVTSIRCGLFLSTTTKERRQDGEGVHYQSRDQKSDWRRDTLRLWRSDLTYSLVV